MKTLAAAAALALLLATATQAAEPWKLRSGDDPEHAKTCAPSVLEWMQTVGKDVLFDGAVHNEHTLIGEVRWRDGTHEFVIVGYRTGKGYCVLAVQEISAE